MVQKRADRAVRERRHGREDGEAGCLVPEHLLLAVADQDLEGAAVENPGGPLELLGGQVVGREGDEAGRRLLDDLHAADAVRLEARDRSRGNAGADPRTDRLEML